MASHLKKQQKQHEGGHWLVTGVISPCSRHVYLPSPPESAPAPESVHVINPEGFKHAASLSSGTPPR